MIVLSPQSALMLYLCFSLAVLLGLWSFSHWRTRSKTIFKEEKELFVCEYCHSAYVADSIKSVTQCPDCQSYNKHNSFKNRKS